MKRRFTISILCLIVVLFACGCVEDERYFITFMDATTPIGTVVTDNEGRALLPVPQKSGYTFDGWYVDSALTKKVSDEVRISSDSKFYAKWQSNSYVVTLDYNGGTLGLSSFVVNSNEFMRPIASPRKEHYVFVCWTYEGERVDFSKPFSYATNVTFVAKWSANQTKIIYDALGGAVTDGKNTYVGNAVTQYAIYGERFIPYVAKREGFEFLGWTEALQATDSWNTDVAVIRVQARYKRK